MKVTFEDAGPCRKIMKVSTGPDEVQGEYDSVLREYTKYATIKGFRQGRAPVNIVERQYRKSISEEAKDRLVPQFYRQALVQNKITPVAIVDVKDVSFGRELGLSFRVTVDVAPDIKLPRYKKISLKGTDVTVSDEDVEKQYAVLIDSYAKYTDVTSGRGVKETDLVCVDYSGTCGGQPVDVVAPGNTGLGEQKDFWLVVGMREFLPGLGAGLKGCVVGDKKDIKVLFPADFRAQQLAGKEAVYSVTVKGIREKVPPVIDQEFLKPFGVDSEQALKARVKERVVATAQQQEKERLMNEITHFLLMNTECDLPQSIVEEEKHLMIRNIVDRIRREGGTTEQLIEKKQDILNSAEKSSTDRVKLAYILAKIAEEEKISVKDEEIDERIKGMASYYDMPPEKLKAEIEKKNGTERLASDIRSEKTMDFLLENAKINK